MTNKMIIVHPGKAHTDDFMASCVCSFKTNLPIYRQSVESFMLDDPDYFVLDQGLRFEPELHNFDHHQIPATICAFTQILDYFYPSVDFRSSLKNIKIVEMFDVYGPKGVANLIGATEEQIYLLSNPIVSSMIGVFSEVEGKVPDYLLKVMQDIGRVFCESIESKDILFECLEKNAQSFEFEGTSILDVTKCVIPDGYTHADLPTKEWCRETQKVEPSVILTVNVRNGGFRMISTNTDKVKFTNHPLVGFCHNSGFLVTFVNYEDFRTILREAKVC